MATNPQARVLELLKRFNDGKKVCIEALQNDTMWFAKSKKIIRRDLDVIKEYFPDSFELIRASKGEKGCYKAITKDVFNNFMDKDTLALMGDRSNF
jgi:predicted DNA-binding transcriptional regulator YafY